MKLFEVQLKYLYNFVSGIQKQQYIGDSQLLEREKHLVREPMQQIPKKGTLIRLVDPDTGKDLTHDVFKPKEKSFFNRNNEEEKLRSDVNANFAALVSIFY